MKAKKKIFCTLGPASLNNSFLRHAEKNNVDLVRLNLSHLSLNKLEESIKFIRKTSNLKICLDTEGAQIRTKYNTKKGKFFSKGKKGIIFSERKNFSIYPSTAYEKLKIGDILDIGFNDLKIKIYKKNKKKAYFETLTSGLLENNKGVHIVNRKISLSFLTEKDFKAIKLAKKYRIKNFALSFTNSHKDIVKFNKLLKNSNKIFKIETYSAIKNFDKMLKFGDNFLIDRGDLSKDISIENIPKTQRYLVSKSIKKNKNMFIATNFLETMIQNSSPTRAEANDIYNSIEMGAAGIVLAAETAIGKYPEKCIDFVKKIISKFNSKKISFK